MATAPQKMTKEDRKTVTEGLQALLASANRSAKAAKSDTIRSAYEGEAARINALINRINSQELEL